MLLPKTWLCLVQSLPPLNSPQCSSQLFHYGIYTLTPCTSFVIMIWEVVSFHCLSQSKLKLHICHSHHWEFIYLFIYFWTHWYRLLIIHSPSTLCPLEFDRLAIILEFAFPPLPTYPSLLYSLSNFFSFKLCHRITFVHAKPLLHSWIYGLLWDLSYLFFPLKIICLP